MDAWLFEGRTTVYVALASVTAFLLYQWWLRRHPKLRQTGRRYLLGALVGLALLAGFHLLDRFVETDREQIEGRVRAMAESVKAGDLAAAFRYFSDEFRSPGGRTKSAFLDLAKSYRNQGRVTDVIVWDFQILDQPDRERGRARVSFQVKAHGDLGRGDQLFGRCEADFDYRPEAGWRLLGFQLFNPVRNNEREPFPY